jgi:hypothetical protein
LGVFHVELRRFPHVARAFNLTEEELQTRIVVPWVRGAAVELQDRRFTPDRARLTIYEGPQIATEDIGLGRGWSSVTRDGENVTAGALEAAGVLFPRASELKRRLTASREPVALSRVVRLAGPGGRPSERLAVAEQAVWELLHEGRGALIRAGDEEPAPPEEWEALLLDWETWVGSRVSLVITPES